MLSLSFWPQAITLSGFYCVRLPVDRDSHNIKECGRCVSVKQQRKKLAEKPILISYDPVPRIRLQINNQQL
jgi:hypothetical protein